ncbi:hypothetical protein ALC62_14308 [Cyphomyrmex costatus]|uniref:C2H2-type domain-containing protein n=1 Tax=Cyphomyrmex costatus TaxID=456900 RepID=A0A151I8S8_9HYME|nr:hypothetical protein ALC62_14308 [Cyphomyrmex costatus]
MAYICSECRTPLRSISALCIHLQIFHSFNALSIYICSQDGCNREYDSVKSFRKHLRKRHSIGQPYQNVHLAENVIEINHDNVDGNPAIHINENVPNNLQENNVDIRQFHEITVINFQNILFQSSLALVAKLYNDLTLNRTQVQNTLDYFKNFASSSFLEVLKDKTLTVLRDNNVSQDEIENLDAMFAAIHNMFSGFETETQRINALEQSFCYVRPTSYVIGMSEKMKKERGNMVLTPVELTAQFISIKRTLKYFLELPGVFKSIMSNIESLKNFEKKGPTAKNLEIESFTDSKTRSSTSDTDNESEYSTSSSKRRLKSNFKSNKRLVKNLETESFTDSKTGSSISDTDNESQHSGSTSKKNKVKSNQTNGIVIQTDSEYTIYFALCQILGDNLGQHAVTGFVESFNAYYYCRFCKEHKSIMKKQLRENILVLRNRINYEDDVLTNNVSQTGIKTRCIWHVLNSYHITENLVCDIMHDLFEGVCHYDLCPILDYLINHMGFFSLETLNDRIQNFDYGDSGDKPTLITVDHIRNQKLKMSASEMMFFVRHFGLIIGDLVPEDDEVWRLYIVFTEILDIVTAPYVRQQLTEYLSTLIAEHHEMYCSLFGKTLKPKHHFMVHYPRIMNLVGPMIHIWSMRLEGKHRSVIKKVANNMSCRKNLPLSIAKRYALTCCARFLTRRGFTNDVKYHPKECRLVNCENFEMFQNILFNRLEQSLAVKEAVICGTCYKSNMILVINYEENLPIFGKLCWIVRPQNVQELYPFFLLSGLQTVGFNEHLHSYKIKSTPEWFLIEYRNLISFYPSTIHVGSDGNTYVTFRHML